MAVAVVERFKKELMYLLAAETKKLAFCRGSTVIDVDFYGESQFKFELYAMSFICLLGTVFLHNFRAELIMGPKFSVFIFVLCLYGVMVSHARLGAPPNSGLHDIKKSPKYRRSIENLQFRPPPHGAHGRKFRENDVKIAEK